MKAFVYRRYGGPEVLKLEDVEKPVLKDNEVLVKVHAASVNPLDWHFMRGLPYLVRILRGVGAPSDITMGMDFAGIVEAVGKDVKRFKLGNEVFGAKGGALAEYLSISEDEPIAFKPANMSFVQAASVPVAAIAALQALRDEGKIQAGKKVLINGASGGVGTFAVQMAKSFGTEVTGVCSTHNVKMVRAIGANHVIDYTKVDFTQGSQRYDLIIDTVRNHTLPDLRRAMTPTATAVLVGASGGPNGEQWLWSITRPIKAMVYSGFVSQKYHTLFADENKEDLAVLGDLMQTGQLTPVIDRQYPLSEVPAAIAYLEQGHARGKILITLK